LAVRAITPVTRFPSAQASWGRFRAQDEFAIQSTRLETAVCLGDLVEGVPPRDARPDGARCQEAEQPLQVFPEPGAMSRPHRIDRIDADGRLPR